MAIRVRQKESFDPELRKIFDDLYEHDFLQERRKHFEAQREKFANDRDSLQILDTEERYLETNGKELAFSSWLDTQVLPDAKRGKKIAGVQLARSKVYSEERRAEWKKYADWLNAYFNRNPSHSLGDGRRACAAKFELNPKTIERRTPGYCKPS
jgi:hypothetical protein